MDNTEKLELPEMIVDFEYHGDLICGFYTTPDFWDCECKCSYIRSKNEDHCVDCFAYRDDQPDSRVDEVEEMLGVKLIRKNKEN